MLKVLTSISTCAAEHAIHLKFVINLSEESCILAIRRFIYITSLDSIDYLVR